MNIRFNHDYFLALFLLFVIIASGGDLLADISAGSSRSHLIQESIILLIALSTLAWILRELHSKRQQINELHNSLEAIRQMPEPSSPEVAEARASLSKAITEQFAEWQLTQSEKDVGLMLLKGYSLKEIALLRGTTEKTIRQQASAIYQKSNLPGRHALSAWFIEDML